LIFHVLGHYKNQLCISLIDICTFRVSRRSKYFICRFLSIWGWSS